MAVTSVHVANLGTTTTLRHLRRPRGVDGLVGWNSMLAAPLGQGPVPLATPGRIVTVAFWENDAALDRFRDQVYATQAEARGWWARLDPIRAHGSWPGLCDEVDRRRAPGDDTDPVVVVTLGRVRLRRLARFLATSAPAEKAALAAPGFLWGTAAARPPLVSTVSVWASAQAAADYAYARAGGPHPHAIDVDRRRDFHMQSAFIRFRIVESGGSLGGHNPLAADLLPVAWRVKPEAAGRSSDCTSRAAVRSR